MIRPALKTISRRRFLLGTLALVPYVLYQEKTVAVRHYEMKIPNLPASFKGFTILHLTDLHNKEYGDRQRELLALLSEHQFHMAVLTGDMVDARNPGADPVMHLVRGLRNKPVYYVRGNHENSLGSACEVARKLSDSGVTILDNAHQKIAVGKDHVWLIGVDDPIVGKARLDLAVSGIPDRSPKVMLAHAPTIFPQAVKEGVDLLLTGHTHGGQVRLPFLGAPYVPRMGLFPQWDYGLFRSGATSMIVNCGIGESIFPVRVNTTPEIVLVSLSDFH